MKAFPKYDRYKDSGVEWLGEVPEHWEVLPGRTCLTLNKETNQGNKENTVLSLSYGRVIVKPPEKLTGLVPTSFEGYQIIAPGDVIIRPTDLQNDTTSLRVGLAKNRGIITSAYLGLRPIQKASSEYLFYLLHAYDLLKVFYGMGTGMRQSLDWRDFKYMRLSLPPRTEQDRIVTFLDEKTSEIDALIAKKQRQIELLDEQKAILINRAVTRGLTPDVPLKDSGVAWIGQIPEHWSLAPLYGRCEVRLGKMLDSSRITGHRLQPYLRNTDVQWFKINTDALPMMDFSIHEYERYSLRVGDLIVCEGGEPGRAAIWENNELCFYQKALHRVRPMQGDKPRFLLYLFRNAVTQAAFSGFEKATIAHLTGEQLRRFRFAFPPLGEQESIAEQLDGHAIAFEAAITKLSSQIQALQTLRSTLIAHAVTGKIRV
jgi:type I restriction enzyme S subunit